MTGDRAELLARARAWAAADPDARDRRELADLIVRQEWEELADRFAGTLEFGTAGLRGRLGAGPNRMNRAVVIRAAAGLASYLRDLTDRQPDVVVVGHDARRGSRVFAHDSAAVFAAAGLDARVLPGPMPTPVLAYAVRALDAAAGVMVTASHNPAPDNGYKVYLGGPAGGGGQQIAPPADAAVAARIAAAPPAAEVPRSAPWTALDGGLAAAYAGRVAALVPPGPRDLRVTYTPLHGVGRDLTLDVFARAGFAEPAVVSEQAEPDPGFPTVAFPNPEEPGALDLALALAADTGADLVVAHDPDADRCAAAVPGAGGFRVLTGDEVGALLADHLAPRLPPGPLATTIVSSSLLERIAASHGRPSARTLTGFKWLTRVPGVAYAYEEALGYCLAPGLVADKDGISAALVLAELAAAEKAAGRTLLDRLDDLARRHGLHATEPLTLRLADAAAVTAAIAGLRARPPCALGGRPVVRVDDLLAPTDGLPPTDGLRLLLPGGRVVVRGSGTEPKLKCYLEVVVPAADDLPAARAVAAAALAAVRTDLAATLT